MTRTIAFCGLGQMGLPMAARLLGAGHKLRVWNRTAEKAKPLLEKGATWCDSPIEAARGAELGITMLSTPQAVEEVVLGDEGLASGLAPESALFEMSTVGPEIVKRLAREVDHLDVFDAPVLGSVPQAQDGTLKVFVGGDKDRLETYRETLAPVGVATWMGPVGSGAAMKLVVNSTLGALMTTLGEALALGDVFGLEQDKVLDVLSDSPIGVTAKRKRPLIESGSYPPSFKLALAQKDMELILDAARTHHVSLPVAEAAYKWWKAAAAAGFGELDYGAVIAHIRHKPAQP